MSTCLGTQLVAILGIAYDLCVDKNKIIRVSCTPYPVPRTPSPCFGKQVVAVLCISYDNMWYTLLHACQMTCQTPSQTSAHGSIFQQKKVYANLQKDFEVFWVLSVFPLLFKYSNSKGLQTAKCSNYLFFLVGFCAEPDRETQSTQALSNHGRLTGKSLFGQHE